MSEHTKGLLAYLLRHHMCVAVQFAAVAPLKVMRWQHQYFKSAHPMKSRIKMCKTKRAYSHFATDLWFRSEQRGEWLYPSIHPVSQLTVQQEHTLKSIQLLPFTPPLKFMSQNCGLCLTGDYQICSFLWKEQKCQEKQIGRQAVYHLCLPTFLHFTRTLLNRASHLHIRDEEVLKRICPSIIDLNGRTLPLLLQQSVSQSNPPLPLLHMMDAFIYHLPESWLFYLRSTDEIKYSAKVLGAIKGASDNFKIAFHSWILSSEQEKFAYVMS